jgi:exonuclease III
MRRHTIGLASLGFDCGTQLKGNMRIVSWNCNMALHEKFDKVAALAPDVAILAECADLQRLQIKSPRISTNAVWVGKNPNKGLGVFAFGSYRVRRHESYDDSINWFLPVEVDGPARLNILAVWAKYYPADKRIHQPGPTIRALGHYRTFLSAQPALIAGDFNNNVEWDRRRHASNHRTMLELSASMGFFSAYHSFSGEEQGRETTPTLHWKTKERDANTYHIDYCLAPDCWRGRIKSVSVGKYDEWIRSSDHMPLVIDVDL